MDVLAQPVPPRQPVGVGADVDGRQRGVPLELRQGSRQAERLHRLFRIVLALAEHRKHGVLPGGGEGGGELAVRLFVRA